MSIEAIGLCHAYNPGTPFAKDALKDVNVRIEAGAFVGVIGHTGSGKSTLVQHFNALLKPTSGKILLDGVDVYDQGKKELRLVRQKVGLVFQYPEHQLFEISVRRDVAFGPENMGIEAGEVEERVERALELVGMPRELYEKSPFELSGGQKRRAAIAGVLAMKPSVLVLDEPTAGLDPRGREEILDTISQMHRDLGITVVLVSHSMEDIARYVSQVVVMHDGGVFRQGGREIFEEAKALEEIGLAAPAACVLIQKLRERGLSLPKMAFTTEEAARVIYSALRTSR